MRDFGFGLTPPSEDTLTIMSEYRALHDIHTEKERIAELKDGDHKTKSEVRLFKHPFWPEADEAIYCADSQNAVTKMGNEGYTP